MAAREAARARLSQPAGVDEALGGRPPTAEERLDDAVYQGRLDTEAEADADRSAPVALGAQPPQGAKEEPHQTEVAQLRRAVEDAIGDGTEVGVRLVLSQGWRYVCLFGSRAMAARNRCVRNAVFSQRLAHSDGAGSPFDRTAG